MVLVDLFSGYGGFHLGLEQAGFKFTKTYFSEIDKHAIANYRYNFKDAEYVGSVTDVQQWGIERPNIITFGSPCQDFSLAGKRAGMDGERSSLIRYAIDAIKRFRPDFFIWENVKGTFSSNGGADFWAIIQSFADIGGYRLEWQLLNTSWFLPQKRPRAYFVGHIAKPGGNIRQIFPIGSTDKWVTKPQNETQGKGQRIWLYNTQANCISARYGKDGSENLIQLPDGRIRRLTEIECERLQGLPDDWTKYGMYENKAGELEKREISSTQRYKLCGNGVTATVVQEIGKRLINNY